MEEALQTLIMIGKYKLCHATSCDQRVQYAAHKILGGFRVP
jgi:hypothetical protein